MESGCPQEMAHLGHGMGGHHSCCVIQGQQQVADKRRTSPASDRGSSAGVVAELTQGAMNGY